MGSDLLETASQYQTPHLMSQAQRMLRDLRQKSKGRIRRSLTKNRCLRGCDQWPRRREDESPYSVQHEVIIKLSRVTLL
jgi:hypothetical protein